MNTNHPSSLYLTDHAQRRMSLRGVNAVDIETVFSFGRMLHTRGACIYAIGKKEVGRLLPKGIDVRDQEGLQVICAPDGKVMTVYRNHDFKGLRH